MSRVAPVQRQETRGNNSDLFDRGQVGQCKLVSRDLSQMAASGAVIGIVVAGERRFVLYWRGGLVVGAFAMVMMASMLRGLVASNVAIRWPMGMSAGC